MSRDFFPKRPDVTPTIYAYELVGVADKAGLLKIGYTNRNADMRIKEQIGATRLKYNIVIDESAMRNDGSVFTDHDVHKHLQKMGKHKINGEWFECTIDDIKSAIMALHRGDISVSNRTQNFKMRPEQSEAIEGTIHYFNSIQHENFNQTPKFLWNAKMRFGKTFTAYQLAKKMGLQKILILTFKPAVQGAWQDDLNEHIDFEGWQFISRKSDLTFENADKTKPIVCFGSFQDYMGKNDVGGIKAKNEWVHTTHWDIVIFDEYHYGAWRDSAKDLFNNADADTKKDKNNEFDQEFDIPEYFSQDLMPITTDYYLYLSGTPFRAIDSGEFIEEQIYNWTYSDEQKAKAEWIGDDNPYLTLPRMVMMTYQLPDSIIEIAKQGEFNEFDLNVFFKAEGDGNNAKFIYENEVQKWLDLIRGAYLATSYDNLKLGTEKPPMPFNDIRLLNVLSHTFWFLPRVNACFAMKNLLEQKQNRFYHDYKIIMVAGNKAGQGADALPPVLAQMGNPLKTKSITLSCGKLTTGVSVKPWTGIFMLRNLTSPETYFQSAFRVQTPWAIKNPDGKSPNKIEILKQECYVFDFAPNRALRQISDYSCRLNVNESSPEKKVEDFIHFLPVLAYDGSSMKRLDASGILDIAMSGTSATMLARRWESALLVNVDNITLARLMKNDDAMRALMQIEGFRNLNQDIETIINKSESIKATKTKANEQKISEKEKKEMTDAEKEYKNKRKEIQEKLQKFATRIPIFMYLSDYREYSLRDVITQLEPALFKKITGLDIPDFNLLVSLGLFNEPLMNDAVYKFKRYEDSSLNYTGVLKYNDIKNIGLYNTNITKEEFFNILI